MYKIEHIGVAVRSLSASRSLFDKLLGTGSYKMEKVESEQVNALFYKVGETKIELLESTSESAVIAKFIEKRGEGIHHIAFDVPDILAEISRLEKEGFEILNKIPKKGADNKLVCFLHPKFTNGILIELCQEIR